MIAREYNENYQTGWIKIFRSMKNHWIFNNDKYFKWWILLLFEVNHKDNKIPLGQDLYIIKKGQSGKSLRTWSNIFNSNTKSVSKFFNLLEKDNMITKKTIGKGKQSTTLINITNYEQYQGTNETQGKRKGNARETQEGYKQEDKNVNNDKDNNILFSVFWDLYDKKNDKKKCEKKWNKLSKSDKEEIIEYIPKYKQSQPNKKYRKDPYTFLNNESWNNEINNPKKQINEFINEHYGN